MAKLQISNEPPSHIKTVKICKPNRKYSSIIKLGIIGTRCQAPARNSIVVQALDRFSFVESLFILGSSELTRFSDYSSLPPNPILELYLRALFFHIIRSFQYSVSATSATSYILQRPISSSSAGGKRRLAASQLTPKAFPCRPELAILQAMLWRSQGCNIDTISQSFQS